ncbi:PH domain-containing protein [Parvularcula sp. ZS-1/3]|uniref:PH domain-containing protein n=1 Tax=Parvularcula mediterranea TaxID=2732508 RepID=A0A7Y3RL24_9PROT|nr:PH domain-containing protein [Parvularcula mediterranea]NNU16038.1 PH domain-containing protein [Parvularcula mediterranea]
MDEGNGERFLTPYVVKSLPEKERLITLARFPTVVRLSSWLELVVLGLGPLAWFFFRLVTAEPSPAELVILLIVSAVGAFIFLVTQIYFHTTEFGLTDQRIIFKSGVISRYTNEIPLQSLENVNLQQGIIGRILNFGRLEVNGSGGSGVWTPLVQDPVSLRAAIADARAATENPVRYRAHAQSIHQQHNNDRKS